MDLFGKKKIEALEARIQKLEGTVEGHWKALSDNNRALMNYLGVKGVIHQPADARLEYVPDQSRNPKKKGKVNA